MELSGEIDEVILESQRTSLPRCNDAARVVEEPLVRNAAEVARRAYKRSDEARRGLLEDELGPDSARVSQQKDEAVERTPAAEHAEMSDVGPIDLRLFPRKRLRAREDFAGPARSALFHHAPHRLEAPRVATLADHVVDPGSDDGRISREGIVDDALIWVEHLGPCPELRLRPERSDDTLDHIAMDG